MNKTGYKKTLLEMDEIEKQICRYISHSQIKITFGSLQKYLFNEFKLSRKQVKSIVLKLIQKGNLCYTNHFGNAYIEPSFERPVEISKNVIIKPPFITFRGSFEKTVLNIEKGVSFGGGNHPSTRLAMQVIDDVFTNYNWKVDKKKLNALDIGTGSGVLAILAAKFGIGFVLGIDTDPCSVFEAKRNVIQNCVEGKVAILDGDLTVVKKNFSVVFANLRLPTLIALRIPLEEKMSKNGIAVISGLKQEELKNIRNEYRKSGFFELNHKQEMGWAACCLFRGDLVGEKTLCIT